MEININSIFTAFISVLKNAASKIYISFFNRIGLRHTFAEPPKNKNQLFNMKKKVK